jgi:hypothetical protein
MQGRLAGKKAAAGDSAGQSGGDTRREEVAGPGPRTQGTDCKPAPPR